MPRIDIRFDDPALSIALAGRLSIFLDMSIWIDLVDSASVQATRCQDELRRLVHEGVAFCPLSETTLQELYKQEPDSALRVAQLMEELSLNVAFAPTERTIQREIKRFIYGIILGSHTPLGLAELYVPFIGYLAPGAYLDFPDESTEEQQEVIVDLVVQRLQSLTAYIETIQGSLPRTYPMPRPELETRWKENWERSNRNRKRMNRIEEEYVAANVLLPRVQAITKTLPFLDHVRVAKTLAAFPKDKDGSSLQTILQYCPTSRLRIAVAQAVGLSPEQKITMNHYFDMEQLPLPLAYSDVYVTRDRWINHLLAKGGVLQKARPGIRHITSVEGLGTYLCGLNLGC